MRVVRLAAVPLALLGALAALAPDTAGATRLPPVHVTYAGSYVFKVTSAPKTYEEKGSWSAEGSSGGHDGALPLKFTQLSGGRVNLNDSECEGERDSTAWSINDGSNPAVGDWSLEESSAYPSGAWKYIVPGAPSSLPAIVKYTCPPAFEETVISEQLSTEEAIQPVPVPRSGAAEVEALFAPFEFEPGKQASRTRTIDYAGPVGNCSGVSECETISIVGRVSITVTSPRGNNGEREHGRGGGRGKGGKAKGEGRGSAGERRRSEAQREQLKRQAREDLTPALESAWAAHGLSAALGIAGGVGISEVASDLSGGPVSVYGEGAIGRIAADYRIAKDPPASGFTRFAEPKRAQPRELASCASYTGEASSYCESLRGAETKLLLSSDTVLAIDEAMYTTIA